MSDRAVRLVVALLVPVAALAVAHWCDRSLLQEALQRYQASFDTGGYANVLTATHVVGGVAALAVVLAALWARSIAVGALYVIAGGTIVLLPALWAALAIAPNGAAAVAPDSLARFLNDQMFSGIASGPTGMALTVGGAMLVAGIAAILLQTWPGARPAASTAPSAGARPA